MAGLATITADASPGDSQRNLLLWCNPTLGSKRVLGCLLGLLAAFVAGPAAADDITWLVEYDGRRLPQSQGWTATGPLANGARVVDGSLRLIDDSNTEDGGFRMAWTPDPSREIVVEARVRVESMEGSRGGKSTSLWPFVEGAPVGLLISDGRWQGGLVFRPEKIATFVDRVAIMDAKREFHTYRLVIRGTDMSVDVDGVRKIQGQGAFAKPADSPEAFVHFGSNAKAPQGEAYWSHVRLGLRQPAAATPPPSKLRIVFSEPWDIPPPAPGMRHTRPFVHNMGRGLLLMSVAQGPDAVMEPYGVLKSTDEGRTWQPIPGLQVKSFAPQSFVRLPDGDILGVSRWTVRYAREEGAYIGMSYRFDPRAERFTMFESLIQVPEGMGEWMAFNRDFFEIGNGEVLASVYGAAKGGRRAMLLKSADGGKTWTHFSTLGPRPEPAVVQFSRTDMMALLRINGWMPFEQIWSQDGGRTWTPPIVIEEGSVDPDLVYMSHGVLACSYGRPGSNLMFSTDRGKTWTNHHVIAYERGFNYTAIREVRPGRLLYVHDAPRMRALYVDVERQD